MQQKCNSAETESFLNKEGFVRSRKRCIVGTQVGQWRIYKELLYKEKLWLDYFAATIFYIDHLDFKLSSFSSVMLN